MPAFWVVDDFVVEIGFYCFIPILEVGDNGLDTANFQALIRSHAHPACQQRITTDDGFLHASVFHFRLRVGTLRIKMSMVLFLTHEMNEVGFGTRFMYSDFSIFHSKNQKVLRSSKMCADGFLIVSYDCNFHSGFPKEWI
jgi:hypothetical protein